MSSHRIVATTIPPEPWCRFWVTAFGKQVRETKNVTLKLRSISTQKNRSIRHSFSKLLPSKKDALVVRCRYGLVDRRHFSSLPIEDNEDDDCEYNDDPPREKCHTPSSKHCETCTCEEEELESVDPGQNPELCDLGHLQRNEPFPPPLEEPRFTFLRRLLDHPGTLALDSAQGKQRLLRALLQDTAESYFPLFNHFSNQSEPAYCGVTTLLVVLNAFAIDPLVRWKGGWRYFGHEDLLLQTCCLEPERVRRAGIHLNQFAQLASCQGLRVQVKRPSPFDNETTDTTNDVEYSSLDDFRQDVLQVLKRSTQQKPDDNHLKSLLVVSYARNGLGQTGNAGHFSPVAAYDESTDSLLVLDVARFKYPPFWVNLKDLYLAMKFIDPTTQQPRGWLVLKPPPLSTNYYQGSVIANEVMIPADQVPAMGEEPACPAHTVKVEFCPNNDSKNSVPKTG